MEAQDGSEHATPDDHICSLEWVAWAMDAARQYNEWNPVHGLDYLQYYADQRCEL